MNNGDDRRIFSLQNSQSAKKTFLAESVRKAAKIIAKWLLQYKLHQNKS